jgi:hypothetical protein
MLKDKRVVSLSLALLSIVVISTMAALRGQSVVETASAQQEKDVDDYSPVADYNDSETIDEAKRSKKKKKDGRFRKGIIEERNGTGDIIISNEWLDRLPAFPIALSDRIVIGEVTDAQAYLSTNKTGIFSEFTILIEEVLKNNTSTLLYQGATIATEREGGSVRYPSGRIQRYKFQYQGVPRPHRRYLLFLRSAVPGETPYILTGYELRTGRVYPVDGVNVHQGGSKLAQFAAYEEADENTFLKAARDAIVRQTQAISEGVR